MNNLLQLEIDRLNSIQSEWMKLDSNASDKEKNRVIASMKTLPTSYITGMNNNHNIMINGSTPLYSQGNVTLKEIKERAESLGISSDISWNCAGEWIAI